MLGAYLEPLEGAKVAEPARAPPKLSKQVLHTRSPMFETYQREAFCDAWKAL